jgi:hypothetical protein
VGAGGCLEGFEHPQADTGTGAQNEAAVAITANLLGLLVSFIGEPLTLQIVRDAWPETALDENNPKSEAD